MNNHSRREGPDGSERNADRAKAPPSERNQRLLERDNGRASGYEHREKARHRDPDGFPDVVDHDRQSQRKDRQRSRERDRSRDPERSPGLRRSRERDRQRDRSAERLRSREQDWDRERSRDRLKSGGRAYDRERGRSSYDGRSDGPSGRHHHQDHDRDRHRRSDQPQEPDRRERGRQRDRYRRSRSQSQSRSPVRRRRRVDRQDAAQGPEDHQVQPTRQGESSGPRDPAASGDESESEEAKMARLMGFSTLKTTRGKHVAGNNEAGAVDVIKVRTWRQYMNRRGGFNRPLDKV